MGSASGFCKDSEREQILGRSSCTISRPHSSGLCAAFVHVHVLCPEVPCAQDLCAHITGDSQTLLGFKGGQQHLCAWGFCLASGEQEALPFRNRKELGLGPALKVRAPVKPACFQVP